MKKLIFLTLLTSALLPSVTLAAAPGLQVNPLKYQSTLLGNDVRNGYVDVANPSDTTLNIQSSVQAFRQDNLAGDLSFFNNNTVSQAVTLGLTNFQLGPQEAVRVAFSVDPTKLPKGGTYAVIFFRTIPPKQSSSTSFVAESANVGTLLLLQNGPVGAHIGRVAQLNLPFFQFGAGITGTAQYQNTNHSLAPVAFSPSLTVRVLPWGKGTKFTAPYVLPVSTRQFDLIRPGSYLGFLPVSLIDNVSGVATTRWVLACTGIYAFSLVLPLSFIIVWMASRVLRNLPLTPRFFRRRSRRNNEKVSRSLDGLGPKTS